MPLDNKVCWKYQNCVCLFLKLYFGNTAFNLIVLIVFLMLIRRLFHVN